MVETRKVERDKLRREIERERERNRGGSERRVRNALVRCREVTREGRETRGQWRSTLLLSRKQVHGEIGGGAWDIVESDMAVSSCEASSGSKSLASLHAWDTCILQNMLRDVRWRILFYAHYFIFRGEQSW